MKLLVDTNVLIDGYLKRPPFVEDWKKIRLCQTAGDVELWASAKSFTDVHFIAGKELGTYAIQRAIASSLDFLNVCSIDGNDIKTAAKAEWKDFEDCIIYQAARKVGADFILTRNAKDFEEKGIPAIAPQEFLARMNEQFEFVNEEDLE